MVDKNIKTSNNERVNRIVVNVEKMPEGATLTKMLITNSLEETYELGREIAGLLESGDVLCLSGDLGAGKTSLTKGIAAGLGITQPVTSPTFTIMKEYQSGRLPLYHFDLYRLGDAAIYEDLGYEEYFYGSGVSVLEWAVFIEEILPTNRLDIDIRISDDDKREFTLTYPATSKWKGIWS